MQISQERKEILTRKTLFIIFAGFAVARNDLRPENGRLNKKALKFGLNKSMDWFLYGNGLRHERVRYSKF